LSDETQTAFSCLVDNAFEFLSKALDEVQHHPKHSIINFFAAVELFIKARLMAKDWSLIISNQKKEHDWSRFVRGDFHSVSLDEGLSRLESHLGAPLPKETQQSFCAIKLHRNRMMHFYHESTAKAAPSSLMEHVAKQELVAWYHLNQLLTGQWLTIFEAWRPQIYAIQAGMKRIESYLDVVFREKEPSIEVHRNSGCEIHSCPACGHQSFLRHAEADSSAFATLCQCLVCEFTSKAIKMICGLCNQSTTLFEDGWSACGCKTEHSPEDIRDRLRKQLGITDEALLDDANCSECDGHFTVMQLASDHWFCTSCFAEFEEVHSCGWCDELNTGDMDQSFVAGCNQCSGSSGWHDRD
jgi:hypothetical protein